MSHDDRRTTDAQAPHGYLRERELASRWRVSQRTLQRWRAERYGPAYFLIGGAVRYRLADILAFEEGRRVGGRGA